MVPLLAQPGPHPIWGYNDEFEQLSLQALDLAAAGGSETVRVFLRWGRIEGEPDQYGWEPYDRLLGEMYSRGIRPLLVLSHTPCWATQKCEPLPPPPEYFEAIASVRPPGPDALDDAGEVAALAAQRYPYALGIEVWNEPNLKKFWYPAPDPELYSALVGEVARAVHAANPEMPVIAAGLAPQKEDDAGGIGYENFLRRAYAAGGLQLADAIGAHPYPLRPYKADYLGSIRAQLYRYLRVMAEFGDADKPIWVTEVGVAEGDGYTLDQQADALVKIYALFRRIANTPVLLYHRLIDYVSSVYPEARYGVVSQSGELKPAYCAMAAAREHPC